MPSQIIGTGAALPKRVVTNLELSTRLGVSEREIEKRSGIKTRHWVEEGETTSSLALEAARKALESAQLSADAVDLILVSTSSPDMFFPSTACLVQKGLSARPVAALDLNASCSGFLYALSVADQYLRTRSVKNVLVISAEVKSPFVNPDDPSTAFLFGDGAGAVVLSQGERGIRSVRIYADGSRHKLIHLPAGSSRLPTTSGSLQEGLNFMKMDGKALFRTAVRKMETAFLSLMKESSEIDLFIFHQANLRILEALFKKQQIEPGMTHITIDRYGNTSSSSIPIALDEVVREGRLKPGNQVALCAFGGGLTWGTALLDW